MKTFFHIWTVPIILAIISSIGLLSALNGDSIWDALSWLALAIPLIVGGYFLWLALKKKRLR
ncbi:MAG: hypothetical protein EOO89_20520 [Pedobacter sp.]|nr:MAG: hypothetical protein EOO89_20520 [Pedobacter sp.]